MDTQVKSAPSRWQSLADQVLSGYQITRDEGLEILHAADDELLELLAAAYRVRQKYFGKQVQLYYLKNAKSGLCPEDCGYCSQARGSKADIPKYRMLNEEKLMDGAKAADEAKAGTYCIVASGRGPTDKEVEHVASVVEKIKSSYDLRICCCLGLLNEDQAKRLQQAGVNRINHNLNTSREYYEKICTTHTYEDRLQTLKVARDAGMELCSGLIVGMGETPEDIVDATFELRALETKSIPVNFLNSIEGTSLEAVDELDPRYCLKALCLFRLAHPATEIRIAGGREVNLRSMQAMGLYPANSMFVSDYLTTKGQSPEADYEMIADLGFEVIISGHEMEASGEAPAMAAQSESC
ncbi:biotin synthase BioB [uncultured Gimesia sp.]|jgi:biotin synthase|uniref:biotin synthase BioB n=1 Tax=uncultured Gimesia sp. TaxID=1678688 RepID=UPI00260311F5|nr:biotin synthase BioB [uncultured Gimesia sp.]